tara:strand:- start:555 stop:668 length:114 start_codon:yes stop_codon:yes gene_type:complete
MELVQNTKFADIIFIRSWIENFGSPKVAMIRLFGMWL